jgi:CTP synthase
MICGKYIDQKDAYKSLDEALVHSGAKNKVTVYTHYIDSELELNDEIFEEILKNMHGVLLPSGFGDRGIGGKINIARYARENDIPFLGICLGMQMAIVEFANNVCKLKNAHSTEFKEIPKHPIIHKRHDLDRMRLGAYPCIIKQGTLAEKVYQKNEISERHRNGFEFNERYRELIEKHGMVVSGLSPDGTLAEIIEIPALKFYMGVQFHPEFKSRPDSSHPIFDAFIKAAREQ